MSLTQRSVQPIDKVVPNNNNFTDLKLNNLIKPSTVVNKLQDSIIGQGL